MKKPLSIYGAGRGKTTLVGVVLWIEGEKSGGIVETEDLTIKEGKEDGLIAYGGMNVIHVMRWCSVICQGSVLWLLMYSCFHDTQITRNTNFPAGKINS